MTSEIKNPLNMVPDPFNGVGFILPPTFCTTERRAWFRRTNEILAFLYVSTLSFNEATKRYEVLIPKLPFKENTPIKISLHGGNSATMPAKRIVKLTTEGIDVITRQVFVMMYGSLETYLFQLFERSYPQIDRTNNFLDISLEILMRKKWDGKFCKMKEVFGIDYRCGRLETHFHDFEMNFSGKFYKKPLSFLDELVQIRHKIVHASSILEGDKLIVIDTQVFNPYYTFCSLLTDYIDDLFAKRFGYQREEVSPAEA